MKSFRELVTDSVNEGTDVAKVIRDLLKKELNLTSRDVSVKASSGGTSSSVRVSIKSEKALVLKSKIENIAKSKESVDRDDSTGEILAGGNTFIFTEIDWDFNNSMTTKIQDEVIKKANGELMDGDQVTIFGTFTVSNENGNEYWVSAKGGGGVSTTDSFLGIGGAVMNLIRKLKDDSLYLKIK